MSSPGDRLQLYSGATVVTTFPLRGAGRDGSAMPELSQACHLQAARNAGPPTGLVSQNVAVNATYSCRPSVSYAGAVFA